MIKRIMALVLCVIMLLPCLVSCGNKATDELRGAYITMHLADRVYDYDPANAYGNDSALKVVSLLYMPLFRMTENGKVEKELVKSYTIKEDTVSHEYKMTVTLKDSYWSDGTPISANDVVYAWKRILDVESSSAAAPLLYQIKNAKAVKEGDLSIDALKIYSINTTTLEIYFEEKFDEKGKLAIDYDGFIRNLTSYALVPLREVIVSRTPDPFDWAKKPATMACSGPFMLRRSTYTPENDSLVLERNPYYLRNKDKDALDKYVTPYRLIVDYTLSADEIMEGYKNGEIFYVGEIPLSYRAEYKKKAEVSDALSTHTYYLNEKAVIGGKNLFAIREVREALSLAIDRNAIAEAVVFAKAATALVPYGLFNTDSAKKDFRKVGGDIISTSADLDAAKAKLSAAGINASTYSFKISVPEYDEVHVLIAEMVADAWKALGFKVSVDKVSAVVNDDEGQTGEIPTDIYDDLFLERFVKGEYEVAGVDLISYCSDAFAMLSNFAVGFSGQAMDMGKKDENGQPIYELPTHITGYENKEYTALIEKAYATASYTERAKLLHEAETLLMGDMPVIPILFNEDAYLSRKLSNVDSTYYGTRFFNDLKQRNWKKYVPAE